MVIKSGSTVIPPSWEKENFALTWIDENGKEKNYAYYHTYDYDGGEWENDACWKQGSTKILDDSVKFDPGEGLWFYVAASAYSTYIRQLNLPDRRSVQ